MTKSLVVRSAPLPIAEPGGRGAGMRPQLDCLMRKPSSQYFSLLVCMRSTLSAAVLKTDAALRRLSSLLPRINCALKASKDVIGRGLETITLEISGGSVGSGCVPARRPVKRSCASVISPQATLKTVTRCHECGQVCVLELQVQLLFHLNQLGRWHWLRDKVGIGLLVIVFFFKPASLRTVRGIVDKPEIWGLFKEIMAALVENAQKICFESRRSGLLAVCTLARRPDRFKETHGSKICCPSGRRSNKTGI